MGRKIIEITENDMIGSETLLFIFRMEIRIRIKTGNAEFKISNIDENDKETFELFHRGDTKGIFQFERPEIQECLKQLNSVCMGDLFVLKALYMNAFHMSKSRYMDYISEFIKRKNHPGFIKYPLSCLEEILKETYGIIVYHEQIIQIAQKIAGFSFEEADLLRRDLGKKKANVIMAREKQFEDGAVKNGYSIENANEIFELLNKVSGYTYCKSSVVAYSKLAYQTAWLKCHYPEEFWELVPKDQEKFYGLDVHLAKLLEIWGINYADFD